MTVKKQDARAVVPYTYSMRFVGMKYGDLISDAAKTLRFTQGVRTRVGLAVGLPIGNSKVGWSGSGGGKSGGRGLHAACCCGLLPPPLPSHFSNPPHTPPLSGHQPHRGVRHR